MPLTNLTDNYEDDDEDMLEIYGDDSLTLDPAQIPLTPVVNPSDDEEEEMELEEGEIYDSELEEVAQPPPPQDAPPPPPAVPDDPPPPPPPQEHPSPPRQPKDFRKASNAIAIPTGPRNGHMSFQNPYLAHLPHPAAVIPLRRWANYETNLFDNDRLMAFTTARPVPLGF